MLNIFFKLVLTSLLMLSAASFSFSARPRTSPYMKMMVESTKDEILKKVEKNIPRGSVVVIKYGGHAMEDFELAKYFCEDIADLCRIGILPVVVHGGGPQIARTLKSLEIVSTFVNGLRVTDDKTMEVAQMVLCGTINKNIVGRRIPLVIFRSLTDHERTAGMISKQTGIRGAIGLSGLDSKLIVAKVKQPELGLVGEPMEVNSKLIKDLLALQIVPVIAPVGFNIDGSGSLNINADTAAGAVAEGLKVLSSYLLLEYSNKQLKLSLLTLSVPQKFVGRQVAIADRYHRGTR